ncbi:arginine--tRNA ligase [Candidatus Kaiserbacteria bacterium]|nr:arginine--tRNA ligase [Candidatus Kaiserbacteria bacterium]
MKYNTCMDTAQGIREAITGALGQLGISAAAETITLEFPADMAHGDYATNVALVFAKQVGMAPRDMATMIVEKLGTIDGVARIDIAGPGFINFTLSSQALAISLNEALIQDAWGASDVCPDETVMVEYTDPNPFKAFHIGHLMSNTIGESIARLLQFSGAKVIRANYQGDLGVHVACAIWGIQKLGIHPESADEFGTAYAAGATAYKEDPVAKKEIDEINTKLYERSDPALNILYDTGRTTSLEAFERIYGILGTHFDHYFFESQTAPIGKNIVITHPDIFPESEGARVFKGEEHGLHTRVFINAKGIPTYEAKELGLEKLKKDLYPETKLLIIVTGNEVVDFFRVVKRALELTYPHIADEMVHVPHGMMKLPTGKMSSRTGDVITGESLLRELAAAAKVRVTESRAGDTEKLSQEVAVAAIKYQILKQDSSKDIVFDRERSLSLEGDSGPYLQYTYARTGAVVGKAHMQGIESRVDMNAEPTEVVRLIHRFPAVVEQAARDLKPHLITQYLLSLASAFNSWYAQVQIIDTSEHAPHKVAVTAAVNRTLKNGLWILGIPAPEKM